MWACGPGQDGNVAAAACPSLPWLPGIFHFKPTYLTFSGFFIGRKHFSFPKLLVTCQHTSFPMAQPYLLPVLALGKSRKN